MTDLAEGSSAGLRVSSRAWTVAGAISVILALLSALATFLVLAGMVPVVPTQEVVISLFIVNAVLIVILLGLVAKETFRLIRARRAGLAAAGLHSRVVGFFALVAAAPALLVAVVGWLTLERGLDIQ